MKYTVLLLCALAACNPPTRETTTSGHALCDPRFQHPYWYETYNATLAGCIAYDADVCLARAEYTARKTHGCNR